MVSCLLARRVIYKRCLKKSKSNPFKWSLLASAKKEQEDWDRHTDELADHNIQVNLRIGRMQDLSIFQT